MRIALFLVAFVVGVLLLAPLDRWLLPSIQRPIADAGGNLRMDGLHFALPAGIEGTGISLEAGDAGLQIDSLYFGLMRDFVADACGGQVRGHADRDSITMNLSHIDPSHCLHLGKLELESVLDGSLALAGVDLLRPVLTADSSLRIDLASEGGVFRGVIPHAGGAGADLPLGEWEFTDLVLKATLTNGRLAVDEGHTNTSGVEWELTGATLPPAGSRGGLRIDFRARQAEDNPRSRALMGVMPRTTADAAGWHNYRVVGTMNAPRVVAAD